MKKLIIFLGLLSITWGCNDDSLTDLNVDTKNPSTGVPSGALLGNAQKNLFDQMTSTNVNINVFRLFAQHWSETTYLDEANYDILQRNIPDRHWRVLYRDVLRDLAEATTLTKAENAVTAAEEAIKQNKLAIIEVLNVYTYTILVDTYGNIPYSQALSPDQSPTPSYDDSKAIYTDLFKRLNTAIASLKPSAKSFGAADFIYSGDVAHWVKFANSLKLRMAITVADEPTFAALAKTSAEQAVAGGLISSSDDNALLYYKGTQPNTNPIYEDLVTSGRYDFVAADPLVSRMNTLNDPRRSKYYIPIKGEFIGAPYGQGVDFEEYSSAGDPADENGPHTILLSPTLPGVLLDYSEVEFYLAEAVERGFAVGGTAASHYDKAVTASIIYWGGTPTEATAYLAQPSVAYATAASNWRQKIGTQAWIGFYNRGYEAWTSWRRLDFPALTAPSSAVPAAEGQIPKRYTYPVLEQTLNKANYQAAGTAIGGDKLKTKLFWDKF